MDVIPAIDIRGGRCVRLGAHGDYERETVYGVDPVAIAQHWAGLGATRLHVVDLDAAKEGRPVNDALIRRIVTELSIRVQVAGGVRDHAAIHRWADAGADRIVVGTLAVEQPEIVEKAMVKHRDKVSVAVDARGGKAAVKGWLQTTDTSVEPFILDMARRGVQHFVYTDIGREGLAQHPDFAHVEDVARVVADATGAPNGFVPMIYSGGVTSSDDIAALARLNIEGAISGTALYDGSMTLQAAQDAAAAR